MKDGCWGPLRPYPNRRDLPSRARFELSSFKDGLRIFLHAQVKPPALERGLLPRAGLTAAIGPEPPMPVRSRERKKCAMSGHRALGIVSPRRGYSARGALSSCIVPDRGSCGGRRVGGPRRPRSEPREWPRAYACKSRATTPRIYICCQGSSQLQNELRSALYVDRLCTPETIGLRCGPCDNWQR
jgi:hypothetical protein